MIRNVEFDAGSQKKELYSHARLQAPPRGKSPSEWEECQLVAWLSSRGQLDTSGFSKEDLVARVGTIMASPERNCLRTLDIESTKGCGLLLRKMYGTFNSFHSSLVAGDECGKRAQNRSQAYAMLFLSHSLSFLKLQVGEDVAESILFKKCTMFGLLRSSTHFQHIFELKSLDEGGENGEGYVKLMRKYLRHGLNNGWNIHLHQKMHRESGIQHLRWCILQSFGDSIDRTQQDPPCSSSTERDFRKYKTRQDFLEHFLAGHCLSFVVLCSSNGLRQFGIVIKVNQGNWVYSQVQALRERVDEHGFKYFGLQLDQTHHIIHQKNPVAISIAEIETVAIGLPFYRVDHWVHAIILPDGRHLNVTRDDCLSFKV